MDKERENVDGSRYGKGKEKDWDDMSHLFGKDINSEEDNFLDEVHVSLAQQITQQLDNPADEETYEEDDMSRKKKKRLKKGVKITLGIFGGIFLLALILLPTGLGKKIVVNLVGNYIYGNLEYSGNDKDNGTNGTSNNVKPVYNDIVNILLVGVEEIGGGANTDSIMIATMDTKTNSVKVTSIMRDLYVTIPGYNKNRINAAFSRGGIETLEETIEVNLGIEVDGYAMVNFDSFEKIIDLLGGIEISLTKGEADYLNSTNYISDPANRKVVEGKQILNGNQALGYARVRKVSTGTENNDFGRTQRHRMIIDAIFSKLKSKNIIDLGLTMNNILTQVDIKTDIPNKGFNTLLDMGVSMDLFDLNMETYRIPSDGSYVNAKVQMGQYKQEVLEPKDWAATREELYNFIYEPQLPTTIIPEAN